MENSKFRLFLQRRQVMAFALQQSLKILQLSELELAEWIQGEIERNPLLEELPRKNSPSLPLADVASKPSLRDHLLTQARDSFSDYSIAEHLIDLLDERGFLTLPLQELPWSETKILDVLAILQTFDPPGICARNLQEALLLQLQKSPYSLAEILIRDHFQDLLQKRFKTVQKKLNISPEDFKSALNQISKLRTRPAEAFASELPTHWVSDLTIEEKEEGWIVRVGEDELPPFRILERYIEFQKGYTKEEQETLKSWHVSARWLARSIRRRKVTLLAIGKLLLKKQAFYFETGKRLNPISIKELADYLHVHPATAWRAVANKTLWTPHGIVPLHNFFSEAAARDPIKDLLCRLIKQEDKTAPYTDESLSSLLKENGLPCARRTVSKYRKALKIGSATQRKLIH